LALSEVGCMLMPATFLFYPQNFSLYPITSLFLFFWAYWLFPKKKPKPSTTSSRSGLSVTFFRSAKYPLYQ